MTSRGVPSLLELRFSIDDRPGVLRAADITAALGLPAEMANSGDIEIGPSHHRERWSTVSLEILQQARTLPQEASATYASSGPPAPDKLIPTTALCSM